MITFNDIPVGKNFKTIHGIIYRKTSTTHAKPMFDIKNKPIKTGRETTMFYNSKTGVQEVS